MTMLRWFANKSAFGLRRDPEGSEGLQKVSFRVAMSSLRLQQHFVTSAGLLVDEDLLKLKQWKMDSE